MPLKDHIHIVNRYSDVLMTIGFFRNKLWEILRRSLFDRNIRIWHFFFAVLATILSLITEIFAYPLRAILRKRPGKLGVGLIITLISAWNIALFNNEPTLAGYWAYISASSEILYTIIFKSTLMHLNADEIIEALWQPESQALSYLFFLFVIRAFYTLFMTYILGIRDDNPWNKGTSFIYGFTKNYINLKRGFWEVLWEPGLVTIIGWIFYQSYGDYRFALFLWIGAGALCVQEMADYLMRISFEK